jgi:D-alanyl-D-alanine carboxypeptidase
VTSSLDSRLAGIAHRYASRPDTGAVRIRLAIPSQGWSWDNNDRGRYFLASITKLFTTSIVLQLVDAGTLTLETPAVELLPRGLGKDLHRLAGRDRSADITVRHLLAHSSGLPDYFEQRRPDGTTTFGRVLDMDHEWTAEEAVAISREMRPKFAPGAVGRAFYSDTNYQLLGAIIEHVGGQGFDRAVASRITGPLSLPNTAVFGRGSSDSGIDRMLHGREPLHIPRAMGSVQADGGVVSTAQESLRFLKAFITGELFDGAHVREIQEDWRRIFVPLKYGVGIMLFHLPPVLTGMRRVPALVGHSGASGAFLFYAPALDLYVAGTVNQVKKRSLPFKLMAELVSQVTRESAT